MKKAILGTGILLISMVSLGQQNLEDKKKVAALSKKIEWTNLVTEKKSINSNTAVERKSLVAKPGLNASTMVGQDRGGGLVVKIKGQVMTLAEAGLLLAKEQQVKAFPVYYPISENTKAEVRRIVRLIPSYTGFSDVLEKEILASRDTFIQSAGLDKKTKKKLLADYKQALHPVKLRPEQMLLPAVSTITSEYETSVTYILPEFNELNATQQALILIHEMHMRKVKTTYEEPHLTVKKLVEILAADNAIYSFLQAKQANQQVDILPMLIKMRNLGSVPTQVLVANAIYSTQMKVGRVLLESELVLNVKRVGQDHLDHDRELNPSMAQLSFGSIAGHLPEAINQATLIVPGEQLVTYGYVRPGWNTQETVMVPGSISETQINSAAKEICATHPPRDEMYLAVLPKYGFTVLGIYCLPKPSVGAVGFEMVGNSDRFLGGGQSRRTWGW